MAPAVLPGEVWEVTGGVGVGGIIVRKEKALSSQQAGRLADGSLVQAVEHDAAARRLRYQLLSGQGPQRGWVSTAVQDRELLVRKAVRSSKKGEQKCTLGFGSKTMKRVSGKAMAPDLGALGISSYQQWKVASSKTKAAVPPAWHAPTRPTARISAIGAPEEVAEQRLCDWCRLPLGDFGYADSYNSEKVLHGECQALYVLQVAEEEEKGRRRRDAAWKKARRAEYNISWKVQSIPGNASLAAKLGCRVSNVNGMCGIVLDQDAGGAHAVPTLDPARSVKLEYLSAALRVRTLEGREPLFSLDPTSRSGAAEELEQRWQRKRFEPEWLAGSSAGEVMFQADVYLKELSMGEHGQPVVGMRSCLDLAQEERLEPEWSGRTWFVIRGASVEVGEDRCLIPRVEMGVEAREQVKVDGALQDALITSPDHPLVRYAEEFSSYFDLIAERKSVIYHLRELAKAAALAKFLAEADVGLADAWYCEDEGRVDAGASEIPQMWNERLSVEIQVKDGQILHVDKGSVANLLGLYGGVDLGVPARARVPKLTTASGRITQQAGLLAVSTDDMISYATHRQAGLGPLPGARAVTYGGPRGVDLSLNNFSLAEAMPSGVRGGAAPLVGGAFWAALDDAGSGGACGLPGLQGELLGELFHPSLSDRREEGDRFVPPDLTGEYVQKLQALLCRESEIRQKRKAAFFSAEFQASSAGSLFPRSWSPELAISSQGVAAAPPPRGAELREVLDRNPRTEELLKSTTPVFDKRTEEGTRFRIYHKGSLEARSVQEHGTEELVGVLFTSHRPAAPRPGPAPLQAAEAAPAGGQQVVRATQYVEAASHLQGVGGSLAPRAGQPRAHHYYVVLETDTGDFIVTEMLPGAGVLCSENPADLEARSSGAKVTRSAALGHGAEALRVEAARGRLRGLAEAGGGSLEAISSRDCERYAREVFDSFLPAKERRWSSLTAEEQAAARALGAARAVWGRGEDVGEPQGRAWRDLEEDQQKLARTLGITDIYWGEAICWVPQSKVWGNLQEGQREALTMLGTTNAADWDGASRAKLRSCPGAAWAKSWEQLGEQERIAAKDLGLHGDVAWEQACWHVGPAWERSWAHLTSEEKEAATLLGATSELGWERRGAKVWRKGWQDLSLEEREAAGVLGFDRPSWALVV